MSDGFITVGQCVEGLPLGRFVGELLFLAFLCWFLLGGINESTPLAFSFVTTKWQTTERSLALMAAALALGNLLAVALGGWISDRLGRVPVIRTALLLTISCSMVLQTAHSFQEALIARFLLGLVSGALISVMPTLLAELMPNRNRAFHLTVWCSGWPMGAFSAVLLGSVAPGLSWRVFYTILLVPAVIVYLCTKADMLPESPRYLYLVGRREEGYLTLLEMYEKEQLPLPWAAETIAVACAPGLESNSQRAALTKRASISGAIVGAWLALAMFLTSAAAQCMKIWMPVLLLRHRGALQAGSGPHAEQLLQLPASSREPFLFLQAMAGSGSMVTSFTGAEHPGVMLTAPSHNAILVLAQAYAVEFLGTILCAYMSTWMRRRQLVLYSIPAAALLTILSLAAAEHHWLLLCGPVVGLQRAAQVCTLNFLYVFAAEFYPTCRRAKAVALVAFASQLGAFAAPALGGLVVERLAGTLAPVCFLFGLYTLAWLAAHRLPISGGGSGRPLHDVDEEPRRGAKEATARLRKREFMTYQTM